MEKPVLYMLVGIPGSGKSYWAETRCHDANFTVFSSDEYRKHLLGNVNDVEHNSLIFNTLHRDIINHLSQGKSACYDATNIKRKDRVQFLKKIREINCTKIAIVFDVDDEIIKYQNEHRDRIVPYQVIERMQNKFTIPTKDEGFDEIYTIQRTDCCLKCKFCKRLKHDFVVGTGYKDSHCCTMLLTLYEAEKDKYTNEDTCEPWIQEVHPVSLCEMFVPKEQNQILSLKNPRKLATLVVR